MRRVFAGLFLAGLLAAHPPHSFAQALVVANPAGQTHTVDLAELEHLPAIEERISFVTGHGGEESTYTGALLWSVLDHAGMLDGNPRARVHETVAVTGRDGYVAVLALAEIDPEFEGKQVLLAYRRDGQPIAGNEVRLVVPGDKRGGRSVRDVVRIEIR